MRRDDPDVIASELRRRGLEAPASLLLAAHRPLRPLLAHVATFLAPTLRPVLGRQIGGLEAALADDAAYDRLLDALDEGTHG